MPITIHLPRGLYQGVLADLRRPHAHAAERIGFLYGRLAPGGPLVVMTRYLPVLDDQYVVDDTVGARINGDAIRAAMQGVLDTGDGVFHTVISRTVKFPETTVAGEPITSYATSSGGAAAYRQLARELIAR